MYSYFLLIETVLPGGRSLAHRAQKAKALKVPRQGYLSSLQ